MIRKDAFWAKPWIFKLLMNIWRPFRGAGIRVEYIAPDFREISVSLKRRWYNRNIAGTHFGGSLYAMCDPFYMLMLLYNLGEDYIVWDRAGAIEHLLPPKSTVRARFSLSRAQLDYIREKTENGRKYQPDFLVDIGDEHDEVVARVVKTIYIRKKPGR